MKLYLLVRQNPFEHEFEVGIYSSLEEAQAAQEVVHSVSGEWHYSGTQWFRGRWSNPNEPWFGIRELELGATRTRPDGPWMDSTYAKLKA